MGAPRSKSRTKMLVVTRAPASRLHSEPTPPQHSSLGASCTMVATWVKWTATSAEARGRREGKVEATEQQDAEERGVDPHERTRRDRREGHATACSALSTQQSTFCTGECWPPGPLRCHPRPWNRRRSGTQSQIMPSRGLETAHTPQIVGSSGRSPQIWCIARMQETCDHMGCDIG